MRGKQWNNGGASIWLWRLLGSTGKNSLSPTSKHSSVTNPSLCIATGWHPADLLDLDGTKRMDTLKLIPLLVVVHQQNGIEIQIGGGFGNITEVRKGGHAHNLSITAPSRH